MTCQFTTLFDSYYLSRGLAMYDSLKKNCTDFHLYIFAFDDKSEGILKQMKLANVTVISLSEFEDERLLAVKGQRSKGEYCWTCTSSTIYYCITRFNLDHCTYIDADLFFFANPTVLVEELKDKSILITEHRYSKSYNKSIKLGIYCVQFVTFKNNKQGMKVLAWWRDRCIEWCYDRMEDGKFGDQKYLDNWLTQFEGVYVLKHLGGGLAPWNIQQFDVLQEGTSKFSVLEKTTGKKYGVVFYHFHAVRFLADEMVDLSAYKLPASALKLYVVYLQHIQSVNIKLKQYNFNPIVQPYQTKRSIPHFIHKIARFVLGVYNIFNIHRFTNHGKAA